jgi:isocitrate dehydrogenase
MRFGINIDYKKKKNIRPLRVSGPKGSKLNRQSLRLSTKNNKLKQFDGEEQDEKEVEEEQDEKEVEEEQDEKEVEGNWDGDEEEVKWGDLTAVEDAEEKVKL